MGVISLLFALAFTASAQNSLPSQIPVQYRDFSGGYVDAVDPVNLKPNESPSLLNVQVDNPVGSIKPRAGMIRCGSLPSGNTPTALFEYAKSDGTRRLIASDNANIYQTPDCVTWTTVQTGLSSSAQVHFATVRDKLWIVNGSTWPRTWDGTTVSILDGRANTPNPTIPKCAFIEFWKERVWCGAPAGDPSAIYFSALTDTNGNDLDPSTGTLAWPAANAFQIDQNAGSRLYFVKAYRNRLYGGKDNGIWEVGFDNEFNNFVRKTYASVGSRYQTSVTEVDGILYFTGRDGIYAFDGDNAVRISEKIKNKFLTLNQPLISQNYKTWTTKADFDAGTLTTASTSDEDGSVTISSFAAIFANGDFETGALGDWRCYKSGTQETDKCGLIGGNLPAIEGSYSSSVTAHVGSSGGASTYVRLLSVAGSTLTTISVTPTSDCSNSTYTLNTSAYEGQSVMLAITADGGSGNPGLSILYSPTFTARNQVTFQGAGGCFGGNYRGFDRIDNFQSFQYRDTGIWESETYNMVSVSTFGAFSANGTENGGSILYEVKVGSNTGAIAARSYVAITPGTVINGTTDQVYIKVRVTLASNTDNTNSPRLDDVQIAWNNGGANTQKIHAFGWKNALWVNASSGTASSNNVVLRRAPNPLDSWTIYDLNIGPMATFNDVFYAGASTHSAIYRMDFGTNDDGAAINWHWESKDENFGLPNNAKKLPEMNADYRNDAACNIRMGYVEDENVTYCVGNFPSTTALSGGVGSRRLNFSGGPAYTYRFKVCDNTLDQTPTIIGVGAWATPINRRGD